jgi:hypothetical protein
VQRCEEDRLEEEHGRVALRDALRDELGYGGIEEHGEMGIECGERRILRKNCGLAVISEDGHDGRRIA